MQQFSAQHYCLFISFLLPLSDHGHYGMVLISYAELWGGIALVGIPAKVFVWCLGFSLLFLFNLSCGLESQFFVTLIHSQVDVSRMGGYVQISKAGSRLELCQDYVTLRLVTSGSDPHVC